jgi:poly [ADP-ribose] polymerase
LSLVDEKTEEYKKIQQYFDNTKGSGSNAKLTDVWQVNRNGEKERFQKFDTLQNRKLLWHGTNIAVVAPIITSGLRIMPHSGGRVGSGIYLASMQEKSASYTSGYGTKACMFLCESALGNQFKVTSDGSHASSLKKAPAGSDSVHAIGKYGIFRYQKCFASQSD